MPAETTLAALNGSVESSVKIVTPLAVTGTPGAAASAGVTPASIVGGSSASFVSWVVHATTASVMAVAAATGRDKIQRGAAER